MENSDNYYFKYLKYKKKYIVMKLKNQEGGGKRYLRGENLENDPLVITPLGNPKNINFKFLLQPEINFIKKQCSKDKKLAKQCNDKNLNTLLGEFFKSEQVGYDISNDISNIASKNKLSTDFILSVLKFHKTWKNNHFLKIEN